MKVVFFLDEINYWCYSTIYNAFSFLLLHLCSLVFGGHYTVQLSLQLLTCSCEESYFLGMFLFSQGNSFLFPEKLTLPFLLDKKLLTWLQACLWQCLALQSLTWAWHICLLNPLQFFLCRLFPVPPWLLVCCRRRCLIRKAFQQHEVSGEIHHELWDRFSWK